MASYRRNQLLNLGGFSRYWR